MTDVAVVTQELETQVAEIAQKVTLIAITDQRSLDAAVEDRAEIKRRLARIEEVMGPICDATHKAWKTATTKREALRGPLVEADKAYSRAMGAYEQEQERLRREAAERDRRERERLEAEERARVAAEQARLLKEEEDRRLAEAGAAEARGDTETAARIIEAPIAPPVVAARPVFVPVAPAPPRPVAAGVSFRDNWSAEVDDLAALVRAIAGECPTCRCTSPHVGSQPITLVAATMPALNQMARALKEAFNVPGVRAVNERLAPQKRS